MEIQNVKIVQKKDLSFLTPSSRQVPKLVGQLHKKIVFYHY